MCTLTADAEIKFQAWRAEAINHVRQLAYTCGLHELLAARKSAARSRKVQTAAQVRALCTKDILLTHYYWWAKT
jgi:hypothetical protein